MLIELALTAGGRGYIVLAGLWSSPVSGAAMNPARLFAPDAVQWDVASSSS
jgi:aquaporin Z